MEYILLYCIAMADCQIVEKVSRVGWTKTRYKENTCQVDKKCKSETFTNKDACLEKVSSVLDNRDGPGSMRYVVKRCVTATRTLTALEDQQR